MATKKVDQKKTKKPQINKQETTAVSTEKVAGKVKTKAVKKEKTVATKDATPVVVAITHKKNEAIKDRTFYPETGTRYRAKTSQQLAFDIVMAGAKNGKNEETIRAELAATRKDNGCERNLDSGYFPFVVACHPEFFEVWSNGDVKVKAEPQPDPNAVKVEKEKTIKKTAVAKKPEVGKAKPKMKPKARNVQKK
jgi:hypothetical protein